MPRRRGTTLVEILIGFAILIMMLGAVYRLFFSQIRTIRLSLEHLTVNENARRLTARLGNDVRNANWIVMPTPVKRETVSRLAPCAPGEVIRLRSQEFSFDVKPPDPRVITTTTVSYTLKKTPTGHLELWRAAKSDGSGPKQVNSNIKICDGIKEMHTWVTLKNPVRTSSIVGLPVKNGLIFPPYDHDGTGPFLLNIRVTLVRPNIPLNKEDMAALTLNTSFAARGRKNQVNP